MSSPVLLIFNYSIIMSKDKERKMSLLYNLLIIMQDCGLPQPLQLSNAGQDWAFTCMCTFSRIVEVVSAFLLFLDFCRTC